MNISFNCQEAENKRKCKKKKRRRIRNKDAKEKKNVQGYELLAYKVFPRVLRNFFVILN